MNRRSAAAALTLAVALAACSPASDPSAGPSGTPSQRLTVFAAASLRSTFTELGSRFEAAHPGTTVTFSFAGSSDLVTQLQQGAPADVFASADTSNMAKATADQLVDGSPVVFATNTLQIAVPPDNPADVRSFQDLTRPRVSVVVCAPVVPCGAAVQKIETATRITLEPVSEEQSVTDVLNKVQTGEADAGLVYVTDVRSAGAKVRGVAFPESRNAVNHYPIGVLTASEHQVLAADFVTLVTGADGHRVLSGAGFGAP